MNLKERQDLFFKYLVLFTITAGILLAALFFTQDSKSQFNSVDEKEKAIYSEFAGFAKSAPQLIVLIDTVISESNKIASQSGGSGIAVQTANGLVNDFISMQHIDLTTNPFLKNVTDLLKVYINASAEKKGNETRRVDLQRQLDECRENLKLKKMGEAFKQSLAPVE